MISSISSRGYYRIRTLFNNHTRRVRSRHSFGRCVIANSNGTSNRLREWNGRVSDAVARPGVSEEFVPLTATQRESAPAALGVEPPYILSIYTLEPKKNIAKLRDAFMPLRQSSRLPNHRLVIVVAWLAECHARHASAEPSGSGCPAYLGSAGRVTTSCPRARRCPGDAVVL